MLQRRFSIEQVLAVSFSIIEEKGYRKTSSDHATIYDVAYVLMPPSENTPFETWEASNKKHTAREKYKIAKEAIAWFKVYQEEDNSPYIQKLKQIYSKGTLTYSDLGVVVSSAWVYLKKTRVKSPIEGKSNEYLGTIGDRIDLRLKLVYYRVYGEYAPRLRLQFEDELGNSFVWWTSTVYLADGLRYKDMQLQKDVFYQIRGTVKEHCEFADRKQTSLVRCSIKAEAKL